MKRKRALVTGGFGFIGSHLVERLLMDGWAVYVVDDLSSNAVPVDILLEEFAQVQAASDGLFVYDICPILESAAFVDYDVIFHLASPVGPVGVLGRAGDIAHQIIADTAFLMDWAVLDGSKLINVSTSEIYGGGKAGLCSEEYPCIIPAETTVRLEYAVGKLAAEIAIRNRCRVSSLKAATVRPFNVAGPRQGVDGGFVVPRFIEQAMNGEPLTVFGDGSQLRAFTHVKDIVDGIMKVAASDCEDGRAWNLGNPGNKLSILELARKVIEVVSSGSAIEFVDPKDIFGELYAEAAEKYPDARKAMHELGWKPQYGVEKTIRDAYQYVVRRREFTGSACLEPEKPGQALRESPSPVKGIDEESIA